MVDVRSDKDRELLKDVAYAVQAEIHIAIGAADGYKRDFGLPANLAGDYYEISFITGNVWVQTNNAEALAAIPSVVGNITKGDNSIRNSQGIIYVNVGEDDDEAPPSITLLVPPDSSNEADGDVTFTYWTSDLDSGVGNCSIIFDQAVNQTDTTIDEGIWQHFYLYNISAGTHNWTINCTDNSPNNNSALASEWLFTV
ncbi:hypothetical protein ACFL96_07710 [Thermoproteota archaeon]